MAQGNESSISAAAMGNSGWMDSELGKHPASGAAPGARMTD